MPLILKIALASLTLLFLTACANPAKTDSYCDFAERIWFSSAKELEGLDTETLRQIKKHNDRVKALCGR